MQADPQENDFNTFYYGRKFVIYYYYDNDGQDNYIFARMGTEVELPPIFGNFEWKTASSKDIEDKEGGRFSAVGKRKDEIIQKLQKTPSFLAKWTAETGLTISGTDQYQKPRIEKAQTALDLVPQLPTAPLPTTSKKVELAVICTRYHEFDAFIKFLEDQARDSVEKVKARTSFLPLISELLLKS